MPADLAAFAFRAVAETLFDHGKPTALTASGQCWSSRIHARLPSWKRSPCCSASPDLETLRTGRGRASTPQSDGSERTFTFYWLAADVGDDCFEVRDPIRIPT